METGNTIARYRYVSDDQDFLFPDVSAHVEVPDPVLDQRTFGIRVADTEKARNSASMLVNKMYSWRGYAGSHQIQKNPNRITLTASDKSTVIGTLTLNIDSPVGLLADQIFKDEIDVIRKRGGKVCELTKLAFDPTVRSKLVLAALFHVVFIYGRRLHKCTDVFIEVNPRHRRFYERMLGFQRLGEIKTNPRVNAPAFLLWLDLDYVEEQIRRFGGTNASPGTERSLYPFFYSKNEEEGITNRLIALG